MRDDLRHLKWKLINQNGLTEKEADKRIRNIQKLEKKKEKKKT